VAQGLGGAPDDGDARGAGAGAHAGVGHADPGGMRALCAGPMAPRRDRVVDDLNGENGGVVDIPYDSMYR